MAKSKPKNVAKANPPPQNVKRKNKRPSNTITSVQGGLALYEKALMSPFDDAAVGARIPDMYSFPTEAAHVRVSYTVTSDSSGDWDFVMMPHPMYSVLSGAGTIAGGTTPTIGGGGLSSSTTYLGAVDSATLSGRFDDYRVVGAGLRVKFVSSYTDAKGRIFYFGKPAAQYCFADSSVDSLGAGPTKQQVYQYLNVPYGSGKVPTSVLTLPMSGQVTASELLEQGNLEMPLRIVSADFSRFRDASDADRGPVLVTENEATDGINNKVSSAFCDQSGWSIAGLRGSGFPVSTLVCQVEVIYHLEGTPALASSSSTLAGAAPKLTTDLTGMWNVVQKAVKSPIAKFVASAAMSAIPGGSNLDRAARVLGLFRG